MDLTDIVDLEHGVYPSRWGVVTREHSGTQSIEIYTFERHPGLYLVRHAIPDELAQTLALDCFTSMLRPPATTNFNKSHGIQICGLWEAVQRGMNLSTTVDANRAQDSIPISAWEVNADGPPATEFLNNLRWASVGPLYDWTERRYRVEDDYVPLPGYVYEFTRDIWSMVSDHALGSRSPYEPNAALINYYKEGDKLCGHKDDAEIDQSKPLVSISLGCPAIFLMGGPEKDFDPTPILLRHGDIAILSGQARQSYHGLPRIFPSVRKHPLEGTDDEPWGPRPLELPSDPTAIQRLLQTCRLNISVRQVS